jgi:hypothetical protein
MCLTSLIFCLHWKKGRPIIYLDYSYDFLGMKYVKFLHACFYWHNAGSNTVNSSTSSFYICMLYGIWAYEDASQHTVSDTQSARSPKHGGNSDRSPSKIMHQNKIWCYKIRKEYLRSKCQMPFKNFWWHFTLNGEARRAPGLTVSHAQMAWEDKVSFAVPRYSHRRPWATAA